MARFYKFFSIIAIVLCASIASAKVWFFPDFQYDADSANNKRSNISNKTSGKTVDEDRGCPTVGGQNPNEEIRFVRQKPVILG